MSEECCKSESREGMVMSNVQIPKPIETLERISFIVPVIGHTSDTVKIMTDCEKNIIYVSAKDAELSDEIKERIMTDVLAELPINPMYDVTKSKATVKDGLLVISIPTKKDRIKTIDVE